MATISAQITLYHVIDILEVRRYYLLQSSTLTKPVKPTTYPPSINWGLTEPSYTEGSTNSLYFVDCTIFSDESFKYSEVSLSSSYEAAKAAYNKANAVETRVINAETRIDQNENAIELRATKTEVTTAINSIDIGGRNYIKYGKGDVKDGFFTYFSKVENGYGEHTLTSKNTWTTCTLLPGFVLGCRDYEVGRNVTMSYDFMIVEWNFPEGADTKEWLIGQRYSNQQNTGGDTTGAYRRVTMHDLPRVGSNGCVANVWYHIEKTLTIPEQAAEGIGDTCVILLHNSNADVSASVTFRIKNVKLEYGNKATDWSPSPEEMATKAEAETAQDAADDALASCDSLETRVTTSESTIQQLADSISMLITDENGSSLMTQTSTGWTFNIGGIADTLSQTADGLTDVSGDIDGINSAITNLNGLLNDIADKTAYIIMTTDDNGDPCIELGKEDNDFKVRITNTSVDFLQGSSPIAWINNNSLYIEKAIVRNELQIGESPGFVWKTRSNNNMGLRWIGG